MVIFKIPKVDLKSATKISSTTREDLFITEFALRSTLKNGVLQWKNPTECNLVSKINERAFKTSKIAFKFNKNFYFNQKL